MFLSPLLIYYYYINWYLCYSVYTDHTTNLYTEHSGKSVEIMVMITNKYLRFLLITVY